jgi:putative transposase
LIRTAATATMMIDIRSLANASPLRYNATHPHLNPTIMSSFDPTHQHRHSIRLPHYDYTQAAAYFITIVTDQRELLFADPVLRQISETFWQRIPQHMPGVNLDSFVVMPNHLHGILWLSKADLGTLTPDTISPSQSDLVAGSLGAVVGNFKSITTRRINQVRKTSGQPVWQRNYYERVIRHDKELNAIRRYILDNPANWRQDEENPARSV